MIFSCSFERVFVGIIFFRSKWLKICLLHKQDLIFSVRLCGFHKQHYKVVRIKRKNRKQ